MKGIPQCGQACAESLTLPLLAEAFDPSHVRQSYASRHACSRTDATLFWTCIKIAKALKELNEEE